MCWWSHNDIPSLVSILYTLWHTISCVIAYWDAKTGSLIVENTTSSKIKSDPTSSFGSMALIAWHSIGPFGMIIALSVIAYIGPFSVTVAQLHLPWHCIRPFGMTLVQLHITCHRFNLFLHQNVGYQNIVYAVVWCYVIYFKLNIGHVGVTSFSHNSSHTNYEIQAEY